MPSQNPTDVAHDARPHVVWDEGNKYISGSKYIHQNSMEGNTKICSEAERDLAVELYLCRTEGEKKRTPIFVRFPAMATVASA